MRLLQVQGLTSDKTVTVVWNGCRGAVVGVHESSAAVRIKVAATGDCASFETWGRTIDLERPLSSRSVLDATPARNCD